MHAVYSGHRAHGHAIAKGASVDRLFAELLGREAGFCSGKGGSMHVTDLGVGMLGANGIVGASAGLATGAAFAAQIRGTDQVAVGVLGDGGMAEGLVHEAMNTASIWRLPVIFLCENNQYAVSLPVERSVAAHPIGAIASAHSIPATTVDGMDVDAVHTAVTAAVGRARAGEGPSFIEATTYRFRGHSRSDPNFGPYRSREEWESWRTRDPIQRFAAQHGLEAQLPEAEQHADATIEAAVAFAQASPEPGPEVALEHVFPSGLSYTGQT